MRDGEIKHKGRSSERGTGKCPTLSKSVELRRTKKNAANENAWMKTATTKILNGTSR